MGGAGGAISTKRYQGACVGRYYAYSKDSRGSTTSILDDAGGCVAAYAYSDYGATARSGDAAFPNEAAFTGGIYDEDAELYYLSARHYDPAGSRFVTQDPARAGGNHYAYCEGDPVNHADPPGLERIVVSGGAFDAIGREI